MKRSHPNGLSDPPISLDLQPRGHNCEEWHDGSIPEPYPLRRNADLIDDTYLDLWSTEIVSLFERLPDVTSDCHQCGPMK